MSVQHPLPYKAHNEAPTNYYGWQVRDAKDCCVATGLTQATALEIVAAVNGREKLVEALKDATSLYDDARADTAYSREKMRQFREVLSEGGAQ